MGVLPDRVAIIIGATSGIGARTAELFALEGARVIVAGRRPAEGRAVAEKVDGVFVRTDIGVEADVAALVAQAVDRYGRLDVLVNSTMGPGASSSIEEMDVDRFHRGLHVNVGGAMLGMKHAARAMSTHERGSIITIASISGHQAGWSSPCYSASKAAVIHLTRVAAVELADRGIRVNSVSPGPILTGVFGKTAGIDPAEADRAAGRAEPVILAAMRSFQPIRRVGLPDDVARAALWLGSDASAFVTGQDLAVDGGILAGRPRSVGLEERALLAETFRTG